MPVRQAWLNIETCKQLNNITEVFKAWVQKSITDPMIAYINEQTVRDLLGHSFQQDVEFRDTHISQDRTTYMPPKIKKRSTALILNSSTEKLVCGIPWI